MDSEINKMCQQKITTVMLVSALRTREYLTEAEVERLIEAARHNR